MTIKLYKCLKFKDKKEFVKEYIFDKAHIYSLIDVV